MEELGPKQVIEAAQEAELLHSEMFPQEAEIPANEENEDVQEEEQAQEEENIEELKKFKARYQTLKGKYEAEVPRLQSELRDLKASVFEKIESMQNKDVAPPEEEDTKFFDAFREEYGDQFYDTLMKMVELRAQKEVKNYIKPVEEKIFSVEETQYAEAQKTFVNFLDSKVEGDWRSLWSGEDEDFIEFAQRPDPSGLYTYGQLIDLYNKNWEGEGLARVFNIYFEEKNGTYEKADKILPKKQKEALVAPSRNTNTQPPKANEKRIWTQQMVEEFKNNDRRGKYDPETSQALWDDLLTALSENRIR